MLHAQIGPAAMRATKHRGHKAHPNSQFLDPIDLSRRLNIVLAERQLQDLQLGKKPYDSDPDLLRARPTQDIRIQKTTSPPDNKRTPLFAAPKTSARWVFRTKPVADHSPQSQTDTSESSYGPRQTTARRIAAIRATRTQQSVTQDRERSEQAEKYTVVLEECASNPGRGSPDDAKEHHHPDWPHGDMVGPKPRRLQLLRRMSPISILKLRLGGENQETDRSTKDAGAQPDTTLEERAVGMHRKSGVFSKLLH